MGCCNNKNYLLELNDIMTDFYFRLVRHDFVINIIQDFNKSSKNYHEFWVLTKLLGIHSELPFQVNFWETAYVNHSETSLDGLLFLFLFLCQGDNFNKLEYIKYYLSVNINLSKENDNSLIMHCQGFRNIILVYFTCLTSLPLNIYINVKKIDDESSENLTKHFNEEVIRSFTDFIIKDYVKKNFYINAGKFLEDNIIFLCDDKLIRQTIYQFKLSQTYLNSKVTLIENSQAGHLESSPEYKPLKNGKRERRGSHQSCNSCKSESIRKSSRKKYKFK